MSVPSSIVVTIGDCIVGEAAARLRHLGGAALTSLWASPDSGLHHLCWRAPAAVETDTALCMDPTDLARAAGTSVVGAWHPRHQPDASATGRWRWI